MLTRCVKHVRESCLSNSHVFQTGVVVPRCSRSAIALRRTTSSSAAGVERKPYYVTTPIFYVNAEPHIGHLHTLVLADVLKRFRQLRDTAGDDDTSDCRTARRSILLTGTDEHGMKIQKVAQEKGMQPIYLCDQVSVRFKDLAIAAGVDYDIFFRTTEERHAKAVQHAWTVLQDKDLIYKARYEGWYSVSDEAYYTPSQIRDEVFADGSKGKVSIDSGRPVEWMEEENYMFRLSAFQDRLIQWLQSSPEAVMPRTRYNEVMSYLTSGPLGDLSISRPRSRLHWGIRVPNDPSHTIYVWIDALLNYVTASGYPKPSAEPFWPADVHVVGKDILRFHAVYWPAMLMALDLPLPKTVLAHAHWTMGGTKMSKSLGNVVNPYDALAKFTRDGVRFFLMSKGGLESDADFGEEHVERDYRKYLAGQAGNLVQRLQSKALLSKLKIALAAEGIGSDPEEHSDTFIAARRAIDQLPGEVDRHMRNFEPSKALDAIFDALGDTNAFMSAMEPWKMDDSASLRRVLGLSIWGTRTASILLQPFIPDSSSALLDRLGVPNDERTWPTAANNTIARAAEQFYQHSEKAKPDQASGVFLALQKSSSSTKQRR